jgi:arylsulfatase A-like enzyme
VRFTRAWSTSSWTLPAHASLFTGLEPDAHGAHALLSGELTLGRVVGGMAPTGIAAGALADSHLTLAELLAERGYRTAAFVGGPWLERSFGLMQGFADADDGVDRIEGRRADELTDRALAWLEGVDPAEPFFLFVNYFDPHVPYEPPPGFDALGETSGAFDPRRQMGDLLAGRRTWTDAERQHAIDRYDGEIGFADQQLGRLLEALRARPHAERALWVVTADHGEAFGEGGRYAHTYWLSEEQIRVPLLVRYPDGRGAGTSRDDPVLLTDVLPLVAAELGFEAPPGIDGVLPGERRQVTARLYRHTMAMRLSPERFDRDLEVAIEWPFKLLRSDTGERQLYRIDGLSEHPAHEPGVAERLAAGLDARRPPARATPAAAPDEAALRALRRLGYVE